MAEADVVTFTVKQLTETTQKYSTWKNYKQPNMAHSFSMGQEENFHLFLSMHLNLFVEE